jgi:hypothetical protein
MTEAYYQITTSLKEGTYLRQKALREKINPLTNKKYTIGDIILAGLESIDGRAE